MLIKLAWRNLWRNKRRTWITIASIFFSVILAFLMGSMQEGSYNNMIENVAGFYSGYAQIQHQDYWEQKSLEKTFVYTDALKQTLKNQKFPGLKAFVPRLESFALASSGKLTKGAMVMGIAPDKEKTIMNPDQSIIKGEYLENGENAILLSEGLADNLNMTINDTVVLLGKGFHGVTAAGEYPVKGIVELGSPELNKQLTFLPLKQAQHLFSCRKRLTAIALMTEDQSYINPITKKLNSLLDKPYEVMTWREMNPDMVQAIEADRGSGMIMLLILYIVIGFGIFGTIIMMTMERKREFAILISIGMHRSRLAFMNFLETIMIAFSGIITGLIGGLPIITYFYFNPLPLSGNIAEVTKSFGIEPVLPFSIDPNVFISQATIVLVIALLTAIYPVTKVLRMDVINEMKR